MQAVENTVHPANPSKALYVTDESVLLQKHMEPDNLRNGTVLFNDCFCLCENPVFSVDRKPRCTSGSC